jgi:hypothetical protein
MMQDSGADDPVVRSIEGVDAIDGKLMNLKVGQVMFALKLLGASNTRCAEINTSDLSAGPTQRVLCGLRRSAAGDKNGIIFAIWLVGPKEMMLRTAPILVLPEPAIVFEIVDGRRIGIAIVKVLDLI